MIQPTVKAQTLPDDLKSHWEDAMAEKFPMTKEEAAAYIQNHYQRASTIFNPDGSISVSVYKEVRVPQGTMPPQHYLHYYEDPAYLGRVYATQDYITITDFKPSAIDAKLKEYKQ